ncbi:MAG: hypothetical protein JW829_02515 [Pirellulales bacterium]|nr:hypothetical protein [Pirellulales bacterium]
MIEGLPDFPTLAEERAFISNWVQVFSDTIDNRLGVRPIIYNSKYVANTYYTTSIASTHELWLAWWRGTGTSNPPVSSDTPLWGDWLFWQWTDEWSVPGIAGAVDGDVFQGTTEELMQLAIGRDPSSPSGIVSITDFEVDEGYFSWSPLFSGSNQGILDGTTAERVTSEAYLSAASQEISIHGDPNGWFLRCLSGIGSPPSDPATNLAIPATGSIGFWLKTEDPGMTVRIALDDPSTADRGIEKSILADGQWHLYEWFLSDDNEWEGWVNGDGIISGSTVTLDSIQFFGAGDVTLYLDAIAHNPMGSLVIVEGDFDTDGDVDGDDLQAWRSGFGLITGATLTDGDANGDGDVDGDDFMIWQLHFGGDSVSYSVHSTIPEPTNAAIFLILLALGLLTKRRISLQSSPLNG